MNNAPASFASTECRQRIANSVSVLYSAYVCRALVQTRIIGFGRFLRDRQFVRKLKKHSKSRSTLVYIFISSLDSAPTKKPSPMTSQSDLLQKARARPPQDRLWAPRGAKFTWRELANLDAKTLIPLFVALNSRALTLFGGVMRKKRKKHQQTRHGKITT